MYFRFNEGTIFCELFRIFVYLALLPMIHQETALLNEM